MGIHTMGIHSMTSTSQPPQEEWVRLWAEWKREPDIVDSGDTGRRVWTDTVVLWRVVRVGHGFFYIEHFEDEPDYSRVIGTPCREAAVPAWVTDKPHSTPLVFDGREIPPK